VLAYVVTHEEMMMNYAVLCGWNEFGEYGGGKKRRKKRSLRVANLTRLALYSLQRVFFNYYLLKKKSLF